jgi:superfamily II DNA or RNA helicase
MSILHAPKLRSVLIPAAEDPGLPGGKAVTFRHNRYVVYPHDYSTTLQLRGLGLPVDSPMMHGGFTFTGRFKPFVHQRVTSSFLSLNRRAFCFNDLGCVDAQTEYLSPAGWRRMDQYDGGEVAQYDPETGRAEFVRPTAYHKTPCATMHRFKSKYGIDMMLSSEHEMLVSPRRGGAPKRMRAWQVMIDADVVAAGGRLPKNPKGSGFTDPQRRCVPVTYDLTGGGLYLSDEEIRLHVAVAADGYIAHPHTGWVVVRVKKARKVERLRTLLTATGTAFSVRRPEYAGAEGFHVFGFRLPGAFKSYPAAWWAADAQQCAVIAEEALLWDGSKGTQYFTTDAPSADFVQHAMIQAGGSARVVWANPKDGGKPCATVTWRRGVDRIGLHGTSGSRLRSNVTEEVPEDGHKYCFEVPTHALVLRRNGCVFMTGNTGKTASCIWAAEYLRQLGLIRRVLVLAPLTTLRDVWEKEILNCAAGVDVEVMRGSTEACRSILAGEAPWIILNHDGIKSRYPQLMADKTIDLVICDEATAFKTPSAERTRCFMKYVLERNKMLWALTGTPMAKLPTDVYTMAKLICPHRVPPSFRAFTDETCIQIGLHKIVPKKGAIDRVMDMLEPAIRYHKRECIDLPPITHNDRKVDVSPEQAKTIKDLQTRFATEVAGKKVNALTAAAQMTKVLQVLQGAIITDTETQEGHITGAPARMSALREIIDASNSKTLVFAPFRLSIQYLMRELERDYGARFIDGSVNERRRADILRAFDEDDSFRVLIAHPKTAAHGLTLTAASTVAWWGPIFSAEEYQQANNRIDRPGQAHHMSVYNLYAHPIEQRFYRALAERMDLQALLLAAVSEM